MRCGCPHCGHVNAQDRNEEGLYFCLSCRKVFFLCPKEVAWWVLGSLAVLFANWVIWFRL